MEIHTFYFEGQRMEAL